MNRPPTSASNFEGVPVYVGIDVHLKRRVVSLRSAGLDLKTFSMNPSPEELAKHPRQHYPGARYLSVYEAGYCGYWIHERLTYVLEEKLQAAYDLYDRPEHFKSVIYPNAGHVYMEEMKLRMLEWFDRHLK